MDILASVGLKHSRMKHPALAAKVSLWPILLAAALFCPALNRPSPAAETPAPAPGGWELAKARGKQVLYFTKSAGFEHSVVKRPGPDQLSHSEKILTELGLKHGFAVTCTKDGSVFTPQNLARYDAIAFYTSGMLTEAGTDKTPPMTAEGKAALLEAVRNGKGFVAFHAANDSFHFQPDTERFVAHGGGVDPYIAMLGGEFIRHGPQQNAPLRVVDRRFPGSETLPADFSPMEEWYTFKDFARDLHVIHLLDTAGMKGIDYRRAPFPYTWARRHGQGRVFYTGLAHREDTWSHPLFQNILLGGLGWAVGNVEADVTPNLEASAPGYREIQPEKEAK
jgi:uncharacterized protein